MQRFEKAIEIYHRKKAENPKYDEVLIAEFIDEMADEFTKKMYEEEYGCHITCESDYLEGLSYITDNKGNKVELWEPADIKKIASNYITIDNENFYDYDLCLWANVKRADTHGIETDAIKIIKMAIADLKDADFPYYPADERAYHWLEAHQNKHKKHKSKKYL